MAAGPRCCSFSCVSASPRSAARSRTSGISARNSSTGNAGSMIYADLVALCQFLPGPASSQVGIAVGLLRGGYLGAVAAWVGFTLPSALAMVLFAYGVGVLGNLESGWLHGLKVAAVAVVAQAVLGMARTLAPDRPRATLAVAATIIALAVPSSWGQIGAIVLGSMVGIGLFREQAPPEHAPLRVGVSRTAGAALLALFFVLLIGLPILASSSSSQALKEFDAFYRAGSLVFGGGHVVLPLLQASVVPPGWVSNEVFLAGYGAAQAVPGPLFTSAAYLGAMLQPSPNGWLGAIICLLAIFLPSFLLIIGGMPFWEDLRRRITARAASMPPWSDCCWQRCIARSGPQVSSVPPTSQWRSPHSCCCSCGGRRRG